MSTSSSVLTALIAAATALVVAGLTQVAVSRRERGSRRYERRRAALLDVQDAALELRNRLADYGAQALRLAGVPRDDVLAAARRGVEDALALFAVRLSRVDDEAVVATGAAWRDRARFHSISDEDVTTADESAAWDAFHTSVARALRSRTGA